MALNMRSTTKVLVTALAVAGSVAAYDDKVFGSNQYDYVIIGGGTSGLTVANRLTENGKSTSLLLFDARLLLPSYLSSALSLGRKLMFV